MARNLGDMVVSIKGDSSSLDSTIDKSEKKLDGFGNTAGSVGKIFTTGAFAAGAAAAIMAFNRIRAEVDKVETAWQAQAEAVAILGNVIKTTGAEAWTTQDALEGLASQLQKTTKFADENIIAMQSVLLGFRNITGKEFDEATKAVLDMATVMKMDLTSAAQAVGKALDNPAQGLDSLSRQGFKFTEQEKEMMKAMTEAGNIAGAQKIILDELAKTYGGAAEKAGELDIALKTKLKNAVGELSEEMGRASARDLAPFRQWLIDIALAAAAAKKEHNDLQDAIDTLAKGATTSKQRLDGEVALLKQMKEGLAVSQSTIGVREEELQAIKDAIYAKEEYIKRLQAQALSEEKLKSSTSKEKIDLAKKELDISTKATDAANRQNKIDVARAKILTDYSSGLADIDRQEKIGILTTEQASQAKLEALKSEIEALNDLAKEYNLTDQTGATLKLRNAEEKRLSSLIKGLGTVNDISWRLFREGEKRNEDIDAYNKLSTETRIANEEAIFEAIKISADKGLEYNKAETEARIASEEKIFEAIRNTADAGLEYNKLETETRIASEEKILEAIKNRTDEGLAFAQKETETRIANEEAILEAIRNRTDEGLEYNKLETETRIANEEAIFEQIRNYADIGLALAKKDTEERIANEEAIFEAIRNNTDLILAYNKKETEDKLASEEEIFEAIRNYADAGLAVAQKETETRIANEEAIFEAIRNYTDAGLALAKKETEDKLANEEAIFEAIRNFEDARLKAEKDTAERIEKTWRDFRESERNDEELLAKQQAKYRASRIDDYAAIAESGVSGFNKILDAANSMFTETGDLSATFIGDMTSGLGEVVSTFDKEAGTVLQVMGNLQNSLQQALNDFVDSIVGNDERIADAFESANNTLIDLRIEGIEKGLDAELNAIDEATNKRLESLGYIDEVGTDLIQKRYDAELDAIDAREAAELASLGIVEETESDRLQKRIDAINQELTEEISARQRAILEQELAELTSAKTIADVRAGYEAEREEAARQLAADNAARDAIELEAARAKQAAEEAAQVQLRKYNRDKAIADKAISLAQAKIAEQKALADLGWFNWGKKDEVRGLYAQIYSAINAIPLPALAQGGIAMPQSGGQVVNVAEAGVPEAILPLDRLDEVLESVGDRQSAGGGMTHLTVTLDSKPILDKIFPATRDGKVLISARSVV